LGTLMFLQVILCKNNSLYIYLL